MSRDEKDLESGIDARAIASALDARTGGDGSLGDVEVHGSLPSTNSRALDDHRAPLLLVALEQTGGRGRHGNSWSSPRGGLYLTYVPPHRLVPERPTDVTLLAALAVADAVDLVLERAEVRGVRALVKWPNDVLVGDGKVAGVLVQVRGMPPNGEGPSPRMAIGVGLNVNATVELDPPRDRHPEEWPVRPMSLRQVAGSPLSLATILVEVVAGMIGRLGSGLDEVALRDYRGRCITLGKRVAFVEGGTRRHGTALDVSEEGGALLMRMEDGAVRSIISGDVRHVREVRG